MPVMDGLEATRLISARKEEGSHPRAKVVFATAHVSESYKAECREAGGTDFLPKPCNIEEVRKLFERVFAGVGALEGSAVV